MRASPTERLYTRLRCLVGLKSTGVKAAGIMVPCCEFGLVWQGWSSQGTWNWKIMENGTVSASNFCADALAKPGRSNRLNLSCRRARFAFVSFRPVVLDLGV